jgi:hypothetical protein|tara:strand:+ start:270 stop:488 length:219 start_codon:yes stop_codon:yes gene_type:complete
VKVKSKGEDMKYKFEETFKVEFEIESESEAKARRSYSELFDKNIQLGFDKWKDTELKILVGKFNLQVIEEEE